eukprot:665311-Amphidinium_carterae.1
MGNKDIIPSLALAMLEFAPEPQHQLTTAPVLRLATVPQHKCHASLWLRFPDTSAIYKAQHEERRRIHLKAIPPG